MEKPTPRAFTLTELLFVTGAVALGVGLLLPALSQVRAQGGQVDSRDNLRTLGAAHATYALDWNGRQLTYVVDDASTYGSYGDWYQNYAQEHGSDGSWSDPGNHPPIYLGWGFDDSGRYRHYFYATVQSANAALVLPVNFTSSVAYFGAFRFPNATQFNEYLGGRFYDDVFYAPRDDVVVEAVGAAFDEPGSYVVSAEVCPTIGDTPAWSSYCMSPAAMFNPDVMRHDDPDDDNANGWFDPWDLDDGFASPSFFHAVYPSLKTHVLEHHWLQNRPADSCNPAFDPGTYGPDCCEPYYFNHGINSSPETLYYDGHVDGLPVSLAMADDAFVRQQMNENWGLWSKDTVWGSGGYLNDYGYDQADTSFHVLTTDGIEGRDRLSASAARGGPDVPGGERGRGLRRPVRRRAPGGEVGRVSSTDRRGP